MAKGAGGLSFSTSEFRRSAFLQIAWCGKCGLTLFGGKIGGLTSEGVDWPKTSPGARFSVFIENGSPESSKSNSASEGMKYLHASKVRPKRPVDVSILTNQV